MSRRFVNLMVDRIISHRAASTLHLINPWRCFYPTTTQASAAANNKTIITEDAHLPRAAISFYEPCSQDVLCDIRFMSLGRSSNDIISMDHEGNTFLYDAAARAVRVLPMPHAPKLSPVSLTVGDGLYLLNGDPGQQEDHPFEALIHCGPSANPIDDRSDEKWYWRSLPPPPCAFDYEDDNERYRRRGYEIGAYTVVGDSQIWISTEGGGTFSRADYGARLLRCSAYSVIGAGGGDRKTQLVASVSCVGWAAGVLKIRWGPAHPGPPVASPLTFSFNTTSGVWSKAGEWALPFSGRVEYAPEHGLWFGFSSQGKHFAACDLGAVSATRPPVLLKMWDELAPPLPKRWVMVSSYLLPLDGGKFCIPRIFDMAGEGWCREKNGNDFMRVDGFAVFTGVEVERGSRGALRMIKHMSRRYSFGCRMARVV
ncbi:uncharacterized protein LOC133920795 [Phragmites australis]|uniref:uncharacterized protein LOC133920795 n=1 Tax=Phragmites australis TaxID=29695 RepID=UPI002D788F9A|nr:uncharacterized protein LOC133920795 [Phragmites australis]